MGILSKIFRQEEPCVPCISPEDLPADASAREEVSAKTTLSPYGVALKKKDEAAGLFIDEDCYLFTGDPGLKTRTIYRKYWMPASCLFLGIGSMVLTRVMSRRVPVYAKGMIWKGPLVAVGSWMVGRKLQEYMDDYTAERDAQFLHYCRLHPEDFPRKERVLFRDYLAPWYPIR